MTSWLKVALSGAVAIILFDALVAFGSVATGISYACGRLGSIVVYALVGYGARQNWGFRGSPGDEIGLPCNVEV